MCSELVKEERHSVSRLQCGAMTSDDGIIDDDDFEQELGCPSNSQVISVLCVCTVSGRQLNILCCLLVMDI